MPIAPVRHLRHPSGRVAPEVLNVYDPHIYTHEAAMRTNIDIDDELMEEAREVTGLKTKKAVVDEALRQLVRRARQREVLKLFGKLGWEGDLDAMRESRFPDLVIEEAQAEEADAPSR